MSFKDRIVMVTGAGVGIGKTTAVTMAKEGAHLILIDKDASALEIAGAEIRKLGRECLLFHSDVSLKEQADKIFLDSFKQFGRLDVLVNNVGLNIQKSTLELTEIEWDFIINTNMKSMFLYSQLAGEIMLKQKSGVVINLSSILGLGGTSRRIAYSASKAAVNSMTQTLACEWALDGVRVNAVAPGYILTEALQNFFDRGTLDPENMLRRTPQGHLGTPEDIAEAILFLASDKAKFITGAVLYVDGGYAAYHGAEPVPSRW
jgi:3-oxoacyl-[acyl-carrier protein] reductase